MEPVHRRKGKKCTWSIEKDVGTFLKKQGNTASKSLENLLSGCTLEKTFRSINSPGLSMLEHKNLKR